MTLSGLGFEKSEGFAIKLNRRSNGVRSLFDSRANFTGDIPCRRESGRDKDLCLRIEADG